MDSSSCGKNLHWRALFVVLILTTMLRLSFSWWFFGFGTGDDTEIVQEGFARAFGLAYSPWQIRHLLLPDIVVAPALRLAAAAGLTSTSDLVWAARLPFVLLASLNIVLVFHLALRWLPNRRPAIIASFLYGLHWIPLAYGSTHFPRTATTTCVLLAALLISMRKRTLWCASLTGFVIAIAFAFRFSEVIFIAPCCALILMEQKSWPEKFQRGLALVGTFLLTATLVIGIEDWLTWGQPFSSLIHFARFTLVDRASSSLVTEQPWYFYLRRLPKWLPLTLLIFFLARLEWRRILRPLLFITIPLVVLSVIHHKELRYLQGVMPFVAIMAATAANTWWRQGRRTLTVILLSLSLVWGFSGITFLSKTSTAAVMAARDLSETSGLERAALSQPWAYGGQLWLQHIVVRDLPVRPTVEELSTAAADCQAIGLYDDVITAVPELAIWLTENDFSTAKTYRSLRSRPVVIFRRECPSKGRIGSERCILFTNGSRCQWPTRCEQCTNHGCHISRFGLPALSR